LKASRSDANRPKTEGPTELLGGSFAISGINGKLRYLSLLFLLFKLFRRFELELAGRLSVVLHDLPDRSDTIRLGLDALGDVDACLFCPGDQPLLSRSTVAALCECFRNNREKIVRPVFAGTPGAPVLFPAWTFAELSALPRGKGGQYVISCHPEAVAEVPVSDPDELTDADTPQALEHLRAISGK
jgi:CTP:molybdopterin cytidylyltransferase MocA